MVQDRLIVLESLCMTWWLRCCRCCCFRTLARVVCSSSREILRGKTLFAGACGRFTSISRLSHYEVTIKYIKYQLHYCTRYVRFIATALLPCLRYKPSNTPTPDPSVDEGLMFVSKKKRNEVQDICYRSVLHHYNCFEVQHFIIMLLRVTRAHTSIILV